MESAETATEHQQGENDHEALALASFSTAYITDHFLYLGLLTSLLGARTLLGAPGIATRSEDATRSSLALTVAPTWPPCGRRPGGLGWGCSSPAAELGRGGRSGLARHVIETNAEVEWLVVSTHILIISNG